MMLQHKLDFTSNYKHKKMHDILLKHFTVALKWIADAIFQLQNIRIWQVKNFAAFVKQQMK